MTFYSEACQDRFVNACLNNQPFGWFVDVGAGTTPDFRGSNTKFFEDLGWKGLVLDSCDSRLQGRKCRKMVQSVGPSNTIPFGVHVFDSVQQVWFRKQSIPLGHLMGVYIASSIANDPVPKLIDYLSIDIEGQDYNAIESFLQYGYSFKVLTIEHNLGSGNPGVADEKRRIFNLLSSKGYIRAVENVGNKATPSDLKAGYPFEDWYINPKYVNYQEITKKIKDGSL